MGLFNLARSVVGKAVMKLGEGINPSPRGSKPLTDLNGDNMFVEVLRGVPVRGTKPAEIQSIIRGLPQNGAAHLIRKPMPKYPNKIAVLINGIDIGSLPDKNGDVAELVGNHAKKGYKIEVNYRKVGGLYEDSLVGLRLLIRMTKPVPPVKKFKNYEYMGDK